MDVVATLTGEMDMVPAGLLFGQGTRPTDIQVGRITIPTLLCYRSPHCGWMVASSTRRSVTTDNILLQTPAQSDSAAPRKTWGAQEYFLATQGDIKKKPSPWKQRQNAWILDETWSPIDQRSHHRRSGKLCQQGSRHLKQRIK